MTSPNSDKNFLSKDSTSLNVNINELTDDHEVSLDDLELISGGDPQQGQEG